MEKETAAVTPEEEENLYVWCFEHEFGVPTRKGFFQKIRAAVEAEREQWLSKPLSEVHKELVKGAVEAEREACAKVAEKMQEAAWPRLQVEHDDDAATQDAVVGEIAAAIRAGGEEK